MTSLSLAKAAVHDGPSIFGSSGEPSDAHERVVFRHDHATGLKAIVAIHSTVLGRALGGTRFYPYGDEHEALADVLRLSRGMTYKAAAAGLPYGGGKAVIIGDPATTKTPELLQAYGSLVESLGGDYVTGGDVGTTADDLDIIGTTTSYVATRTAAAGGTGDTAPLTALGVLHSMRAAAMHAWGEPSLSGRRVGVEGLGKVGRRLVGLLLDEGATVIGCDPSPEARALARGLHPKLALAERVIDEEVDIYGPCAMGGTVTSASAEVIRARIVCGAANNQLLDAPAGDVLQSRGIIWVPDYVANAGGLVQGVGELEGRPTDDVQRDVEAIFDTVDQILRVSSDQSITPGSAADRVVRARIAAATSSADRP
ncbi:Glu/Leu/Phe/Val dehydrogenase dimerization domain-containing protein [Nocardioides panacihumi]|uniref:Glu/Leu/Phe/Val dehydrogenase dimerization domain-containing protein n=1 Tax=Nocardioides panacihumi TaxID=400774 RepID=A0ABN2RU92_9ACTN